MINTPTVPATIRTSLSMWMVATVALVGTALVEAAPATLYDQDFETPAAYSNDGGDVNSFTTIATNYDNQPPGFTFAQTFTVEVLNVSGSQRGMGTAAHGTGWSDPAGIGGDFAIGMLSNAQDDRLGMAFDVGAFSFLNVFVDVSSIDLSTFGGPFVPSGAVPIFRFSLFDNPGGAVGIGGGTLLSSLDLTGTDSEPDVFDWTSGALGLSTAGNTNGNVILQVDLLQGGYAAFDNLRIVADDVAATPSPGVTLLMSALGLLALRRYRRGSRKA